MRTETVTLAGTEYEIRELPLQRNAEWRQLVAEKYQELAELLGETQREDLALSGNVIALLRRGGDLVFQSPETLVELVYAYAPELKTADDDVYESELMEAFAACLRLAFPFGRVTRLIGSLVMTGSVPATTMPISQNSDSPAMAGPNG